MHEAQLCVPNHNRCCDCASEKVQLSPHLTRSPASSGSYLHICFCAIFLLLFHCRVW